MNLLFEICVESLEGALAAQEAGAHRIELCSSLSEGGLTPSAGLIQQTIQHTHLPIHVMIRPRRGDFCYSPTEIDTMIADIQYAKQHGAHGIVLGLLKTDGTIDTENTHRLTQIAHPLPVTFHRAFDLTPNLSEALDTLTNLGIPRVLTSGGAPTAEQGLEQIVQLVAQAQNRIIIMPGSGIQKNNIKTIIQKTGVCEIHFSGRSLITLETHRSQNKIPMDSSEVLGNHQRHITNPNRIRDIIKASQS